MSQLDLIEAWQTIAGTRGLGRKKLAALAVSLVDAEMTAADLAGASPRQLTELGLSMKHAEAASERLRSGIPGAPSNAGWVVPGMEEYPSARLRSPIPPPVLLRTDGNKGLLQAPAIAVAGSRDAAPDVVGFVEALSEAAASQGLNVVSGFARGVDRAAHRAALAAGGTTSVVLASGLTEYVSSPDRLSARPSDVLVVSEFDDDATWSPRRAMQRNATIASLSDVVVVASAGDSGGSLAMGRMSLKEGLRVLVPVGLSGAGAGTSLLAEEGAEELPTADFDWLSEIRVAGRDDTSTAQTLF